MTTKYAILNPQVGEYEYVDNVDKVKEKVAELAMVHYLAHTHNAPVSQIDTDATGAETWSAVDLNTL
jgi:hypothetical protein